MKLLLVLLGCVALKGASITVPVSGTESPLYTYTPDFSFDNFYFAPAFDPTLGTLESVTANWTANLDVWILIGGGGDWQGNQVPFNWAETATVMVTGNTSTPVTMNGSTTVTSINQQYPGEDPFSGPDIPPCGEECYAALSMNFSGQTNLNLNEFGIFYNNIEEFVAGVVVNGDTLPNPDGSPEQIITEPYYYGSTGYLDITTLTYNYVPTPEPKYLGLLAVLLITLAVLRRSRSFHESRNREPASGGYSRTDVEICREPCRGKAEPQSKPYSGDGHGAQILGDAC